MKISFLTGHLPINGSIRRTIEIANELVRRGHEATIYSLDNRCSWLQCDAEIRPQKQVASDTHDALILNKVSKRQGQFMEQSKAGCKLFYVVGMDKMVLKWQLVANGNGVLEQCLGYTIIVNGSWMHDALRELGFESHAVLSGVNTDMFCPVPEKRVGSPTIVMSGDPRPRYETLNIQRAVNRARRKIGNLNLISYFGKGIPQSQMAAFICQGWLFADAQNRAGWNNPVAEAMACGVHVVCTDIGGNRDFAVHNETALMVPVGDVEAMSEAIRELIKDREKAERLAANALERIREYTWSRSVDQLLEVLNEPQIESRWPVG